MNNEDPNNSSSFFNELEDAFEGAMNDGYDEEELEESEESQESSSDFDRDRFDDNKEEKVSESSTEGETSEVGESTTDASTSEISESGGDTSPSTTSDGTSEVSGSSEKNLTNQSETPNETSSPSETLNKGTGEGGPEKPRGNESPTNKFKGENPEGPKLDSGNPSNPNNFGKNKPFNSNPGGNIAKEGAEEAGKDALKKGGEKAAQEAAKEVAKEGAKDAAKLGTTAAAEGGKDAAIAGGAGAAGAAGAGAAGAAGAGAAGAGAAGAGAAGAGAGAAGGAAGAAGTAGLASGPYGWLAIAIILVVIIVIILIILIIVFICLLKYGKNDEFDIGTGYVNNGGDICNMVTVTDTADGSDGTYAFEDYIAGVVNAEISESHDSETFKTFAIAARSYFYKNHVNCSIKGNENKQVFSKKGITDQIKQAVKDTEGLVVTQNGKIVSVMYDALAVEEYDSENVKIKQKNQVIPRSWLSAHGIGETRIKGYINAQHGKGLSQIGTWYLTDHFGYNYKQVFNYYLGDGYQISKLTEFVYYPGVGSKDTKGNELHQPLGQFLVQKGSSTEQFNQYIYNNVKAQGVGTRAGVVAAATSLIGTLYETYNIHLPYTYSGGHGSGVFSGDKNAAHCGINPEWGSSLGSSGYTYGSYGPYYYYGPDCSAFVAWAIYNGGLRNTMDTAASYKNLGATCVATSSSCKGQPGDLIVQPGHVVLIIRAIDNKYQVAEASGKKDGMRIRKLTPKDSDTIVKLDSFYNNPSNVRSSYCS